MRYTITPHTLIDMYGVVAKWPDVIKHPVPVALKEVFDNFDTVPFSMDRNQLLLLRGYCEDLIRYSESNKNQYLQYTDEQYEGIPSGHMIANTRLAARCIVFSSETTIQSAKRIIGTDRKSVV